MRPGLILIVLAILLTGCTVDQYGLRNPEAEAAAAATQNDTYIKRQNAEADLALRRQNAESEAEASRQEIEARRLRAAAEADAIKASGQAKADGALSDHDGPNRETKGESKCTTL